VEMQWRMLQQPGTPEDFVIATGRQESVRRFIELAAAKVGGNAANNIYPADFVLENLKIQTNVIETAWRSGVRRLLFVGSS